MKSIVKVFIVLALAVPAVAGAAESTDKDLCLLSGQGCTQQVDSLTEKITRINKEIAKGNKVYTNQELAQLKAKLESANEAIQVLTVN